MDANLTRTCVFLRPTRQFGYTGGIMLTVRQTSALVVDGTLEEVLELSKDRVFDPEQPSYNLATDILGALSGKTKWSQYFRLRAPIKELREVHVYSRELVTRIIGMTMGEQERLFERVYETLKIEKATELRLDLPWSATKRRTLLVTTWGGGSWDNPKDLPNFINLRLI